MSPKEKKTFKCLLFIIIFFNAESAKINRKNDNTDTTDKCDETSTPSPFSRPV